MARILWSALTLAPGTRLRYAARELRRPILITAAAAVVFQDSKDKLPIYPQIEPEIILQETPSELEKNIGEARHAVTTTYLDAHSRIQRSVSQWIGIEQSVERRVKALVAPEEQLTPAVLYIGVAALTGSVFARGRALPLRLFLPPTLFMVSSYHFLPKTSANVSAYLSDLEDHYFPTLAEKHRTANAHTSMAFERIKEISVKSREGLETGLTTIVDQIQAATGLKLREALRNTSVQADHITHVVQSKAIEVVHDAKQKVEEVSHSATQEAEGVAHTVEQKVHEAISQTSATTPTPVEVTETNANPAHGEGDKQDAVVEQTKAEVKRWV